jgi:beta-lactamase class D
MDRRDALKLLLAAGGSAFAAPLLAEEGAPFVEEEPGLERFFREAGTGGTMAILHTRQNRLMLVNRPRAAIAVAPGASFEIVNLLAALDSGAIENERTTFIWDRTRREREEWNRDLSLAEAFRASALWVDELIAARIGAARLREYVARLDYGNREVDEDLARLWRGTRLRISALEQLDFLTRLYRGALPVSKRAEAIVKEVMIAEQTGDATIRAKTALPLKGAPNVGWSAGWVERGDFVFIFALNMDAPPGRPHDPFGMAKKILAALYVL